MGLRGHGHTPRTSTLGKRPDILLFYEVELDPGTFWMGAENLARLGFDPRTVQPVTSHYTDCTNPH